MSETGAGLATILDRRKHGAEKQHESIRILVMRPARLLDQFQRVATDFTHIASSFQAETVSGALDQQSDFAAAHVIQIEMLIEQTNEWADGAGAIVILGLAQQQSATPLDVA
ncbi:hypothetical protein D3C85_1165660 [compost metagenome]